MRNAVRLLLITLLSPLIAWAQADQRPTASPSPSSSPPAASATGKFHGVLPAEKSQPVKIPRFDSRPVIDGKLDDAVWGNAVVLKDFYQIQPGDNIAPSRQTEVLLGYDSTSLYIAFRAFDDRDGVRATVAKRDAVFDDDTVRILLDTYNDQRKAYILVFNPLGVQADGILTEGSGEDYSVDLVMESKGLITETGYTVEVAVPFKSLRYEAGEGKFWGIHLFRKIKRFNDETSSWMPISRDKSGLLNQAGRIKAPEGISTERTLEIIPSLTLSESGRRVRTLLPDTIRGNAGLIDPGRFVNAPIKFDLGLTVKFGIAPNITLDATLNPDFAQVEADETVVTANQRFPIFFQEKRPFFLEGIDIFQTPLGAVHTRAIVDPNYAVKLTGKRGRHTFGLLLASDNAPGNFSDEERQDPANERFLDKNAYIGVLRLKRDIGKDSTIGVIATTYNFIENHNQLGGFDGRIRVNPKTIFTFQVLGTTSRGFFFDPDVGSSIYRTGNGFGYTWDYRYSARNISYNFFGSGRTRYYQAEVGFTPRVNTNFEGVAASYKSDPKPKARLVSWRVFDGANISFDWQRRIQRWINDTRIELNFQRQTHLHIGLEQGYERIFEEEFGPKRSLTRTGAFFGEDSERSTNLRNLYMSFGSTPASKYIISLFAAYTWGAFDFDFGAGPRFPRVSPPALIDPGAPLNPGRGNLLDIEAEVTYQPTSALRASLTYTKSRLVRHDSRRVAFDQNIYEFRATYQFTRFIFARARIDYNTLPSNMRGQFLLGWTPNPGTSFYVGYNDDLNHHGFNPFTGQLEPGFRRNGRTFFIKISYLVRRGFGGGP